MPRRFVDGEKVEKWVRTCNTLDLDVGEGSYALCIHMHHMWASFVLAR